jgi:hypothetical protein
MQSYRRFLSKPITDPLLTLRDNRSYPQLDPRSDCPTLIGYGIESCQELASALRHSSTYCRIFIKSSPNSSTTSQEHPPWRNWLARPTVNSHRK